MTTNTTEIEPPRISFWNRLRYRFIAYFFMALTNIIVILFNILSYLFMPIAMLFQLVVVVPLSKSSFRFNPNSDYQEITPNDLPLKTWKYFEHARIRFLRQGFSTGKYLSNIDMFPDQHMYTMIMINKEDKIGVGFIYVDNIKAKDENEDVAACEFTCIKDDMIYDVTNNTQPEPFLPIDGRTRMNFDGYDENMLLALFREIQGKLDCQTSDKLIELLENNPRALLQYDIKMMSDANLRRAYMIHNIETNNYHLTWKGAFLATFQSLWPWSSVHRKKLEKHTHKLLASMGIDSEKFFWEKTGDMEFIDLDQQIRTVAQAISFAIPYANKAQHCAQPVSVTITCEGNGQSNINMIDLRYEDTKTYPERGAIWQATYALSLDNTEMQAYETENEDYLLDEEVFTSDDMPMPVAKEKLPDALSEIKGIDQILGLYQSTQDDRTVTDKYYTLTLEYDDRLLVWKIYDYFAENPICTILNARTGEKIRETVDEIDY